MTDGGRFVEEELGCEGRRTDRMQTCGGLRLLSLRRLSRDSCGDASRRPPLGLDGVRTTGLAFSGEQAGTACRAPTCVARSYQEVPAALRRVIWSAVRVRFSAPRFSSSCSPVLAAISGMAGGVLCIIHARIT